MSTGTGAGVAVGIATGGGVGGKYRTITMRRDGSHSTYAPSASEMTRTGTTSVPRYISGGTSSGRISPLIFTRALPSVTWTCEPPFVAVTVLVAWSNGTRGAICSN